MLKNLLDKVRKEIYYHKAASELYRLTDRELNDIGISRADIWGIVRRQKN